jgi:hypothetical protein
MPCAGTNLLPLPKLAISLPATYLQPNLLHKSQQVDLSPGLTPKIAINTYMVYPKSSVNGTNVAAIQGRVTAVLRSIPKNTFADSFQKLYESCQQCVVNDNDYFEGQ